jgi:hypothetical protein
VLRRPRAFRSGAPQVVEGDASSRASTRSDSVADIPALPSTSQLQAQRARFLGLASDGLTAAKRYWWDATYGWYDEQLTDNFAPNPLVMLWAAYQLFEAIDGVAIPRPTPQDKAAVDAFAGMAERYCNPPLRPVGGYLARLHHLGAARGRDSDRGPPPRGHAQAGVPAERDQLDGLGGQALLRREKESLPAQLTARRRACSPGSRPRPAGRVAHVESVGATLRVARCNT